MILAESVTVLHFKIAELYPVLNLSVPDGVMYAISCYNQLGPPRVIHQAIPGPLAAASASSPMKKSRSSVPRFIDRFPPPAPPVRYDGLFATAGRPDPEPPLPAAAPFVAIAVGNTKEGESFPAKPVIDLSACLTGTEHKG